MRAEVISFIALCAALLTVGITLLRVRMVAEGLREIEARAASLEGLHEHRISKLETRRQRLEGQVRTLECVLGALEAQARRRAEIPALRRTEQAALMQYQGPSADPGEGEGPAPERASGALSQTQPGLATRRDRVRIGEVLAGRFLVQREIGRGGMGTVYLAQDGQLGECVALKILGGEPGAGSGAAAERFRREALAARHITHPNVIRIHDLCEDQGQLFLSMEYAPGVTLAELLNRRGRLGLSEARPILAQICDGLAAAHRAGVVHRDLKPENVLVQGSGAEQRVKLIDFGLARASFLRCLTQSGLVLGTPEYMAPEQVRGGEVDARTDIYSLGCVAYHVLTGAPPFLAEAPLGVAFQQCNDEPRPPRALRPELPFGVERALLRALAKDPADRFATVEEFREALLAEPERTVAFLTGQGRVATAAA
jgi:hypothetical protein